MCYLEFPSHETKSTIHEDKKILYLFICQLKHGVGGGIRALVDMSAENTIFLDGSPESLVTSNLEYFKSVNAGVYKVD